MTDVRRYRLIAGDGDETWIVDRWKPGRGVLFRIRPHDTVFARKFVLNLNAPEAEPPRERRAVTCGATSSPLHTALLAFINSLRRARELDEREFETFIDIACSRLAHQAHRLPRWEPK